MIEFRPQPDQETLIVCLRSRWVEADGTVFEELIRRFNEENIEEAGEHFTPRDVVQLMAKLLLRPTRTRMAPRNGMRKAGRLASFEPEFEPKFG